MNLGESYNRLHLFNKVITACNKAILDIIYNYRITDNEHIIAIRAKLIELNNSKIIEESLINGSKAWRLKNY